MESKKQNNDGLESKDAHIEHPLMTYDKLKKLVSDVFYNQNTKTPIFQDDTDGYTLEELYKLRDKGVRCGFRIGGMWTGIGGAIAYREALVKELEDMKVSEYQNDPIKVAELLYREQNPEGKMDCPNSVYETVEKWYFEFLKQLSHTDSTTFYHWCKANKK